MAAASPARSPGGVAQIAEHLYGLVIAERGFPSRPSGFTASVEKLGEGGFGSVFLVGGKLVVKCVLMSNAEDERDFMAEAIAWGKLKKIPELVNNVPFFMGATTYKYGDVAPHMREFRSLMAPSAAGFIIQRYEPVQELGKHILELPTFVDFDRGNALFNNIIKAFDILHRNGYIHRDIKPANILVRTTPGPLYNEPIIIDVGMICEMPCSATGVGGTFSFMPRNYFAPGRRNIQVGRTPNLPVSKRPTPPLANRLAYFVARKLGRESAHPIKPTHDAVHVKEFAEKILPHYTAATDNYALGLTLEHLVKFTDYSGHPEIEEQAKVTIERLKRQVIGELAASVATVRSSGARTTDPANSMPYVFANPARLSPAASPPPAAAAERAFTPLRVANPLHRPKNRSALNRVVVPPTPGGTRRRRRNKRKTRRGGKN
jgi:serine/threonine protein kinase